MKVFIIVSECEVEAENEVMAREVVTQKLEQTGLQFSLYTIDEILLPSDS